MRAGCFAVAALLLAACAPPPASPAALPAALAPTSTSARVVREAPDAPFRQHAPELEAPTPFVPPPIHAFHLSNGVSVLLFESHAQPLVRVELVLEKAGGSFGAASMAAPSVFLGTKLRSEAQLGAARDAELAMSRWWSTTTAIAVGYTALSAHVEPVVELLADVTLHAGLPASPVIRSLQINAERRRAEETPRMAAERILPMALSGASRPQDTFGHLRASDMEALSAVEIKAAYERALDPSGATLIVVGDTTQAAIAPVLERRFGSWKSRRKHAEPPVPEIQLGPQGPRVVVVDRPRSPESYVLFGGPAPAFASTDWSPVQVLVAALGGAQGRLARDLVDQRHVTWSASTELTALPKAARLGSDATLPAARTAEGMRALDRQLRDARDAGVTDAELAETRDRLVRLAPSWLATLDGSTDAVEGVVLQGVAPDDPSKRAARLAAVTSADVRRVAAAYLDPERMKVIVVGDWSAIRAQMLGLGWGDIEVRDASGKVVATEHAP